MIIKNMAELRKREKARRKKLEQKNNIDYVMLRKIVEDIEAGKQEVLI